jgi:hypothetical protein
MSAPVGLNRTVGADRGNAVIAIAIGEETT